jgi:hypothetical protein
MRQSGTVFACLAGMILAAAPTWAQGVGFNMVGSWNGMYHEDELERTDPGPPPGDYTGFPINAAGLYRADAWHPDQVSILEHQCIPHNGPYSLRGPANLNIRAQYDETNGRLLAFIIDGTFGGASRTIWMDARPRPSRFAPHTWAGFSVGTWEGDTLKVVTSHIKAGYLRRNGIFYSDEASYVEFFNLHDKYLTMTTLVYDPIYLTEPLLRTESFAWNPYMNVGPPHAYGATCQPQPEIPREYGWVPHHLPGTNKTVTGFSEAYGVPFEATRGGAETMFPEYRKKLKAMVIPHPVVFENKFKNEHAGLTESSDSPDAAKTATAAKAPAKADAKAAKKENGK